MGLEKWISLSIQFIIDDTLIVPVQRKGCVQLGELEDRFDIEKQLAERKSKATTRTLIGYVVVVILIFGALACFVVMNEFFLDNPIFFVGLIAGVAIVNSVILLFFVIKPSDDSSICLDLMNYLNQKHDAEMKMHIISIEETKEEMEAMDMSGKYPRMFMLYLDRPKLHFLNEVFKIPIYSDGVTGRLMFFIKNPQDAKKSKIIKKAGGMVEHSNSPKDIGSRKPWDIEFSQDKERNKFVGSVYFGYHKGEDTIGVLAKTSDKLLKDLGKIEKGN